MKNKKFLELVNHSHTVLIIASRPLDFDCLGSGLVLKKYLESLGKQVRLIFPSTFTTGDKAFFSFLPYFKEVEDCDSREALSKGNFDLLILVDGVNLVQFYDSRKEAEVPDLNLYDQRIHIDHHLQDRESLGTYSIKNPQSSSTAEIIFNEIIPEKFIDSKIATLLYAAIAGDTGNFQWGFTPSTLEIASLLMRKGADVAVITNRIFNFKSKNYLKMLVVAINNLEYLDEVKTVFLFIPFAKMKDVGLKSDDVIELKKVFTNEVARKVPGYERGVMMYETEPDKINLGARGDNQENKINLPKLFAEIGGNGGGHFNAAGADLTGNFDVTKRKLITAIKSKL